MSIPIWFRRRKENFRNLNYLLILFQSKRRRVLREMKKTQMEFVVELVKNRFDIFGTYSIKMSCVLLLNGKERVFKT